MKENEETIETNYVSHNIISANVEENQQPKIIEI